MCRCVNTAGMIPLIFAQSLLIRPARWPRIRRAETNWVASVAQWISTAMSPTNWLHWAALLWFTVAFTYFYTDVMFRQQNLPDTLQKQGGFIIPHPPRAAH